MVSYNSCLHSFCLWICYVGSLDPYSATYNWWYSSILHALRFSLIWPLQDKTRLSKLLKLAIPAALQPSSMQRSVAIDSDSDLVKEEHGEESLVSKLLRWASASVILGSITNKRSKMYTTISTDRSGIETLQSILEKVIKKECESGEDISISNEALAVMILYLQQLLGRSCSFLPSVVLALCLLLFSNSSNTPGTCPCHSFH